MIAVPSAGKLIEDLAAGPGALIPAIRTSGLGPIPLWRLTIERAWCINTAATGGNAALLALADEKRGSE
jgi:RHH-type proline utilization regulon transcriptional repressor/proline dehydrogenase/delta 1-pyrroline-5-carboxylate dehydrogenase